MKKYKVEFIQTQTFVVDVTATNEKEAKKKAKDKWQEIVVSRTEHLYEIGDDAIDVGTVYDVTNTDDPFDGE